MTKSYQVIKTFYKILCSYFDFPYQHSGSVLRRSKEGVALGEMVSTLDIPCTEGIHVYTCVAYAGEAVLSSEKSVVLPEDTCTDMSGNEETIQKWYSNIMVEIGAPIVLPCDHVSGRHRSHVSWTRDGYNVLELSERVHVGSDGGLVIESADWADMGVYTCTIGGNLDSVDTFLYPLTPDFPAVVGRK